MSRNITRTEILRKLQEIERDLAEYAQNTGDYEDIQTIKLKVKDLWKTV